MKYNLTTRLLLIAVAAFLSVLPLVHVSADQLPDAYMIEGVTGHAQGHRLSCEARSAADVANFWGVELSEEEIMAALPASENPERGFVGNPDDSWGYIPPYSYGVYAGPITQVLQDNGLKSRAVRNASFDDIKFELAAGRPVIVWVIGQMWTGNAQNYSTSDGEEVIVAHNEHTMIIVGYSEETINAWDAYSGTLQTYYRSAFEQSWSTLGNMAVFVRGKKNYSIFGLVPPPPAENPVAEETSMYTVQPGEYLTELANRFQVDWQWLANVNGIPYPWTIYPGQVLRVK